MLSAYRWLIIKHINYDHRKYWFVNGIPISSKVGQHNNPVFRVSVCGSTLLILWQYTINLVAVHY